MKRQQLPKTSACTFAASVLAGSLFLPASAFARQAPPAPAPLPIRTCAPLTASKYSGFVPSFPDAATSPELAKSLILGYHQLFGLHRRELAVATLSRARSSATANDNPCVEALAVFALGANAEDSNFENAEALYRSALNLFAALDSIEGMAATQFRLGRVNATRGDTAQAAIFYELAARGFRSTGDIAAAISAQLQLIREAKDLSYDSLLSEAHAHHLACVEARIQLQWSDAIHASNHLDEAMNHSKIADAIFDRCPNDKDQRAYLQTSMGRMERQQGRPLVALQHYRFALRLQHQSGDLSFVPQTYNAMAVAYENMHDFPHAIAYYRLGLAAARSLHSQPFIDFLEANLGATYTRSGRPAVGIPLLERASQNLTSEYLRCTRLSQLGEAYALANQKERAVTILKNSLTACRSVHESERIMSGLNLTAEAELALHHHTEALADAHEGLVLVEETRAHLIPADAYKQGFIAQTRQLFDTAVASLTALNRPADALEVVEQARARAFLDLLGSHQLERVTANPSPDVVGSGSTNSPAHIAPLTTAAMLDITGQLRSTLLAYWITPHTLYIWIARPGEPVVEVTRSIGSKRLGQMIAETRVPTVSLQIWRSLYSTLITPIEPHLPSEPGALITVVPSGPLFALSFSALLSPMNQYWVERFRTHIIPAVGLLQFTSQNAVASRGTKPLYLFVGNPLHLPLGLSGRPLAPLLSTEREINAIATFLPPGQVHKLLGPQAEIGSILRELPAATVFHVATHAVVSDTDPFSSFLALDDSKGHGRFTLADIYGLHLHTSLVVLSGCGTGRGAITGDGIEGLSRAFFSAGAASVLTTLWDIADRPTAVLMPRFYRELQHGSTPSEALRSAQLSMLADLHAGRITTETFSGIQRLPANVSYWAAFSLAGEP